MAKRSVSADINRPLSVTVTGVCAGVVRLEDVVFQMDVLLRQVNLTQQRFQRGTTAGQNLHALRAAHGQA